MGRVFRVWLGEQGSKVQLVCFCQLPIVRKSDSRIHNLTTGG